MGEALEAYITGQKEAEITVISDIAPDDVIAVKYLFRNYNLMPPLEHLALQECRGKILDVGAGAGSHSLWLQEHGKQVIAMDISTKAVEVMQKRGIKQAIQADIWQFQPEEKFDTILLLMNGVGLAGTLGNLVGFLRHLKDMLNPGGQILLESADILYMFEEEDGSVVLDLNAAYYGQVQYQMEFNGQKGNSFPWLFIDADLLAEYAKNAGLATEVLFEGTEGQFLARLY